ncbi:hypothetical protein REPUB_Repub19eG0042800 [Reevesia pubescens]
MRRSLLRSSRSSPENSRKDLKRVFEQYGKKDGEGQIRLYKDDLKNAFEYLGALMPGYKAVAALKYIDTDKNGYIKGNELDALIEYAYGSGYRQ